jgi:unsaturated rhamnogalacturonyl hydrolase
MAITDVLDYLPQDHPDRDSLITILQNTCDALLKVRDEKTGLWYQVLNQGGMQGNYIEGSGSAMFTYVFAKGANKGYLDRKYLGIAGETFSSIVKELITEDENGLLTMHNICGGCGLGGNPYRDGSYEYYINEKKVDNDPKGVAPFIIAAIELGR